MTYEISMTPQAKDDLRIMSVDNYLVFYIPNHEENVVTVIRVMYGGRDIDWQLKSMAAKD